MQQGKKVERKGAANEAARDAALKKMEKNSLKQQDVHCMEHEAYDAADQRAVDSNEL